MNGFALGLALKQRRKATWKLPIKVSYEILVCEHNSFKLTSCLTFSEWTELPICHDDQN